MIKELKHKVEWVLEHHPKTRNSDVLLTIKIWELYYERFLIKDATGYLVKLRDILELPREDNVKRIRAKLNAEGKFLPNDPKVRTARGINEQEWRKFLGYNPELYQV
jgi:hypothetical protein